MFYVLNPTLQQLRAQFVMRKAFPERQAAVRKYISEMKFDYKTLLPAIVD